MEICSVKPSPLVSCFAPDFVFYSIQVACSWSGSIRLVPLGSFVWCCGLGHRACPPLSWAVDPNCQTNTCVFGCFRDCLRPHVTLESCHMHLGIPPSSRHVLESVPNLLFLFPSFPPSFLAFLARHGTVHDARAPLGCLWAGPRARVHLVVAQRRLVVDVFLVGIKMPTHRPYFRFSLLAVSLLLSLYFFVSGSTIQPSFPPPWFVSSSSPSFSPSSPLWYTSFLHLFVCHFAWLFACI